MVKRHFSIVIVFALTLLATQSVFADSDSEDIVVKAELQDELPIENRPFFAKITILHPADKKIEPSSFKLDGNKIDAKLKGQTALSETTMINGKINHRKGIVSYYFAKIDPQEKGPHTLPPIEITIAGKQYTTQPVEYIVSDQNKTSVLHLSEYVNAPKPLYPGQSFTATYQISMSEPIEICYDNLPLLDLKEFNKNGKRKHRSFYQGSRHIQEISQSYLVENPGSFDIESSFVEGRSYAEDFFGRRRYKKELIRAEAEPIKIEVTDFPLDGKPDSFNGAIGEFSMNAFLESGNQVCVGDKLKLKVAFEGKEGLSSVRLPSLSNQRGFKELFRLSDLPVLAQKKENEKVFLCEIRPMSEEITEIPKLEFSYFNPKTKSYVTLSTSSIPITLLPMKTMQEPITEIAAATKPKEMDTEIQQALESPSFKEQPSPSLIDIQGVYPIERNKSILPKMIPLKYLISSLMLIVFIQFLFKWFVFSKKKKKNSSYYFQEALKQKDQLQNYQLLLEKALILRLKEQKFLKEVSAVDQMGSQGIVGEVKEFMQDLSMQLFSGQKAFNFDESQAKAKALYKKIGDNL